MKTCAFLPCNQVKTCSLEGGCLRKPGRKKVPLAPAPVVRYNPMMGSRLDLAVTDEPAGVAEARWNKARAAYVKTLEE